MVKSTFVAFVERNEGSSRIGTIELPSGTVKRYPETETAVGIFELARTPHRQRIAYRADESLRLLDLPSGAVVELQKRTAAGNPGHNAYRPDGKRLVVLDASRAITLGAPEPRVTEFEAGQQPVDLLWFANGSGFLILLRSTVRGRGLTMHLCVVSDGDGSLSPRIPVKADRFLGWHDARLMALATVGHDPQAAGFLTMAGEFVPRRIAGKDEEPEIYHHYLARTDRLVLSNMTEHTSDRQSFALTTPGCVGKRPWLEEFPRPEALVFSPDEQLAVFVDRSRAELTDSAYGGDLYLTKVDSAAADATTLLLKASESSGFYSRPLVWTEGDGS
jgi:hypothetical protein